MPIHMIAVIAMVLPGCGRVDATSLVYLSSYVVPNEDKPPDAPKAWFDALPANYAPAVRQLHESVSRLVTSEAMRRELADIDAVVARPRERPLSGRRLAHLYFGLDTTQRRYPICYAFQSGGRSETASTALVTAPAACRAAGTTVALITLRSATMDRAASAVIEARACAVNTLAHEWAHAIGSTTAQNGGHEMTFCDQHHHKQPSPVASYVVGAVAQCLYLAEAAGDTFDVRSCVEEVGTNTFDAASCTTDWANRWLPRPR